MKEPLYEFKILLANDEKVIRGMWEHILRSDKRWHFFYEDSYMVVRCDPMSVPYIREYLIVNGFQNAYQENGNWIDNIGITREYQAIFEGLFHAYSMLAMVTLPSEFTDVTDRVLHCYLNNMRSKERMNPVPNLSKEVTWEADCLISNALMRMFIIGTFNPRE